MNRRSFLQGASALVVASRLRPAWATPPRYLVFLGTRGDVKGQGIYSCVFDSATGTCTSPTVASDIELPTALVASADGRYLYSVSEVGNGGQEDGSLTAFAIDGSSGTLKVLNHVPSGGGGPTFIRLDAIGKTIVVASFGSGHTNAFQVLPDGSLGKQTGSMADSGTGPTRRQSGPHAHAVLVTPDNRFVLTADLGADRVFVYRFDAATGALTANDPPFVQMPAGTGPRQLGIHPNGRFVYLMSELVATVTVFSWEAKGGILSPIQTISCLTPGEAGDPSGAAITVHRNGRFLYTTTRNDSMIELFAIDKTKGTIVLGTRVPSGGQEPWGCAIDPSGEHLFTMNHATNSVSIFGIDPNTGTPKQAGPDLSVPAPVSAVFVPVN